MMLRVVNAEAPGLDMMLRRGRAFRLEGTFQAHYRKHAYATFILIAMRILLDYESIFFFCNAHRPARLISGCGLSWPPRYGGCCASAKVPSANCDGSSSRILAPVQELTSHKYPFLN